MKLRIPGGLLALLGTAASATAQLAPPTATPADLSRRAALARDSALTQAAAIRADTESRLKTFKAAFGGLAGIRQGVVGYGIGPNNTSRVQLKKHVVKHKTNGARVEKIEYASPEGQRLLTERYVQGQLVRLELFEYAQVIKGVSPLYESGSWLLVRGDYLRRTRRPYGKAARRAYYFLSRAMPTE